MTLAGLSLAIGPMVDSAIICLENTHRHLGLGATPEEAAFRGASEVAMPELVASLCTLLVLAPLALMPGLGEFLYRPMAAGVAFAMISAYFLSRTFVPSRSAQLAQGRMPGHGHGNREWKRTRAMTMIRSARCRPPMTGEPLAAGCLRRALRAVGGLDRGGDSPGTSGCSIAR